MQALTDLDAIRERSKAEVRHLREGFQQQLEEARTLATESKQAAAAAAGSVGQWRNRWVGLDSQPQGREKSNVPCWGGASTGHQCLAQQLRLYALDFCGCCAIGRSSPSDEFIEMPFQQPGHEDSKT